MNAKISAFQARLAALPQQEQSYASVAAAIPGGGDQVFSSASNNTTSLPRPRQDMLDTIDDITARAKLTLGFAPIEKRDLDRIARIENLSDNQDIMKHAIIDYLRGEMNIKTVSVSDIVKVFPQAGIPVHQCNRLYAQFTSQHIISTVYSRVHRLRTNEHRVMLYAPHTHQDQL